jgi:hypothetical protein
MVASCILSQGNDSNAKPVMILITVKIAFIPKKFIDIVSTE